MAAREAAAPPFVTRAQLEHVIRAAATISGDTEIVVVGSQAMLGRYPDAPPELLVSEDADVYPRNRPEMSDVIDGSIGELSPFHETFGYYAQGVGPTTAVLPRGWEARLVRVETPAGVGLCLDPHDLVLSKYVAGREKDRDYVRAAARHRRVDRATLLTRLEDMTLEAEHVARIRQRIDGDFRAATSPA
jgi:hypothetical protein